MPEIYLVTGTLTDDRSLALDEALPIAPGRVRVSVEPLATPSAILPHREVMAAIRERQRLRGHRPPTREAVDAALRDERESWDE